MPRSAPNSSAHHTLVAGARHPVAFVIGSIALTLALYFPALSLPVFHDDAVVMQAVSGASFRAVLISRIGLAYYRPASLAVWKIYELVSGRSWPAVLHLHNLILFIACGWLIALLAQRLYPDRAAMPWLALSLFLCFPFSYQAVTWTSADVHLQVAAGTLAALLLVDTWWTTGRGYALVLAWLFLTVAVFSHESGVLAVVFMAGWLLYRVYQSGESPIAGQWRRLAIPLAPAGLLALVYVLAWLSVPRISATAHITFQSIGWNLAYFSEGLLYPIAPLGGELSRVGVAPEAAAWIVAVGGLIFLGIMARVTRMAVIWLGVVWYGVGISIAALALPSSYAVDGPRLMLLGSIGAALAWAGVLSGVWDRLRGAWRIIPVLAALACLISGGDFVLTRMALHERMAAVYNTLIRDIPAQSSSVVVNLPAWLAPDMRVYALGNEGVAYVADYYPLAELFWANTGMTPKIRRFVAEDLSPELSGYSFGMVGGTRPPEPSGRVKFIQNVSSVYLVTANDNQWIVLQAHKSDAIMPGAASTFENGIQVTGQARVEPEQSVVLLTLTWRSAQPVTAVPFVHLMCGSHIAAQADGSPIHGLYPFDQWQPGESWQEERVIPLPDSRPGECQLVEIGLTDLRTGKQVPTQEGKQVIQMPVIFAFAL